MRSLSRLFPYIRSHKWPLIAGLACTFLANYFAVKAWVWTMQAVDAFGLPDTSRDLVYPCVVTAFTLFGLGASFRFLMRRLVIDTSRVIEYEFRNDMFAHLQRLPASYYDRSMTGDLMSRMTNDMDAVRMVLGPGLLYPFNVLIIVPLVSAEMLRISGFLMAISMAPLLVAPLFYRFAGRIVHRRFRAVQDWFSEMSARVQENLAGIRVVKAFAREEQEIETFQEMNEEFRRRGMSLMYVMAFMFPLMRVIVGIGMVAVIWAGAREVSLNARNPDVGITPGGLFAFIGLYFELVFPTMALGFVVNVIERGAASMKRVCVILDEKPEPDGQDGEVQTGPRPAIQGRIQFCNLSFAYNGHNVLEDIEIEIQPGKVLGIVGPVGCGKSTLLRLIARLYRPPPGQLLIDGRDVNEIPLQDLRGAISTVAQETFLFSDTLRENIAFGLDGASDKDVRRAARLAALDETIEEFPDQYETVLGERGINLSGGQKQRTAIARALIRDSRILLFDDSLANIDTETEQEILRRLRVELKGRTAILVSHRISTVAMADEIIVLREGRIVERGTHASLVALQGIYADLHHRQRLAEEIEHADDENGAVGPNSDPKSGDARFEERDR